MSQVISDISSIDEDTLAIMQELISSPEAIRIELMKRSLRDYLEQAWHIVEPSRAFVPNWHVDAICEHLEAVTNGEILQLVITVPPRHLKSLTVSVFWPTWAWINHPETRWLFSSYSGDFSLRDSRRCKYIIQSDWYRARWSDRFKLSGDQNAKHRFENDKTGFRIATSIGGLGTGEGADVRVIDDPHKADEMYSKARREEVIRWYDQVWTSRENDPGESASVIIAQRVHHEDLIGHVLKHGEWEHLNLPSEYEKTAHVTNIGWHDPRTKDNELLHPERYSRKRIERAKIELTAFGYAAQHQQRPAPLEGGMIKRHWWQYYDVIPMLDEVVQSWDMTFKDTKSGSYVVGQVWGRKDANKYLLDQVRFRGDFVKTIEMFLKVTEHWPMATRKLVEDKANGPAVISALKSKIGGIIAVQVEGSKEARLAAESADIESGNVFLPDPEAHPWVQDLIEECAIFPNGAYDDQADCTSQVLYDFRKRHMKKVAFV